MNEDYQEFSIKRILYNFINADTLIFDINSVIKVDKNLDIIMIITNNRKNYERYKLEKNLEEYIEIEYLYIKGDTKNLGKKDFYTRFQDIIDGPAVIIYRGLLSNDEYSFSSIKISSNYSNLDEDMSFRIYQYEVSLLIPEYIYQILINSGYSNFVAKIEHSNKNSYIKVDKVKDIIYKILLNRLYFF